MADRTGASNSPAGRQPVVATVVGDVMVDVIVRPAGRIVHGSDTRSHIAIRPGGSAANFAVAMAVAGGHKAPGADGGDGAATVPASSPPVTSPANLEVHLVAAVGDDPLAEMAARSLRTSGVFADLAVVPGATTGTVVALIGTDGERSMLTDRGANHQLAPAAIDEGLLARSTHVHMSGYVLLDGTSRPAGQALLAAAGAAGARISVDACSAGPLADMGADKFLEIVAGADILFANRQEATVLSSQGTPELMLARLRQHFPEVLLTLGAEGALYSGPTTGALEMPAPYHGPVADTAGAGDALTGTFLARRLLGEPVGPALGAGLVAATSVVSRTGARA